MATDSDVPANVLSFLLATPASGSFPTGALINAVSGVFSWTPSAAQGPGTYRVKVRVSDGTAVDEEEIQISVSENNTAPVITSSPTNATIVAGDDFNDQVVANDPDAGAVLTYSASGFPTGLNINSNSGLILGTVSNSSGLYTVTLRVTDNKGATDEASFEITVNNRPIITQPANKVLQIGDVWEFQLLSSDQDAGAALTYSSTGLPSYLSMDKNSGIISGTVPGDAPLGIFPVYLKVTDEDGLFATTSFDITVQQSPLMSTNPLPLNESFQLGNRNFNQETLSIYPNPAQKDFSVQFNVQGKSEWKFILYNTLGHVIRLPGANLEKGVRTVRFDLQPYNLVPGVYYLIMTNNLNEKKTAKIIIE